MLTQPPPSESSCVRAPLLWRPSQKTARLSRRVKKALGAATSPEAKYHTRPRPANNMCAVRSESPSRVTTTCLYSSSSLHRASARPLAKQPNRPLSALEDARDVSLSECARDARVRAAVVVGCTSGNTCRHSQNSLAGRWVSCSKHNAVARTRVRQPVHVDNAWPLRAHDSTTQLTRPPSQEAVSPSRTTDTTRPAKHTVDAIMLNSAMLLMRSGWGGEQQPQGLYLQSEVKYTQATDCSGG